jgi:23S rRNA (cytosine1962-C5)-methyltransferase
VADVRENGVRFLLSFNEGYSVGIFFDQRDNRRRLLANHVARDFPVFESSAHGREVLNTFAYTCGFSVCAAKAGARVTSLDLSRKYLDWGKRNFLLNQLDPAAHDFIYGDAFDWFRRLAHKRRLFDVVILDPPTFSHSKEHGSFQVEKDYGRLIKAMLGVLKTNGLLLACTNAATVKHEDFREGLKESIGSVGRRIRQHHFASQPPDFPITREEPGYLKAFWLRVL